MTNTANQVPKRSARAIARLTWRQVLHTAAWTRTAHGVYVHTDGRKVRVSSASGDAFVRWAADGTRLTPALRVESWSEIRTWATA